MQKLKLLHPLQLTLTDNINYLVCGINDTAICSAAAVTGAITIDDFLDKMRNVTSAFNTSQKRSSPPSVHREKGFKDHKDQQVRRSLKDSSGSSPKNSTSKSASDVCAYCKALGHVKPDYYKLKRKKQQTSAAPSLTSSVAATKEANSSLTQRDSETV